ncbi:phytanoyl-CoA dioxygenase family protein [Candidatus Halocynthiibacter alkanivorans]|uniref:phytanoyl-CoA dioxygenase family protein n=1 Tax=Candidatus Halocynthiibacter alkanivorans TaxID=2267619 RepID=UPI000DF2931D|nr:phytanoyl-CoA dioxygenase family protein [Candidatus Halocynthiibacter alkanivorans]
MELVKAMEEPVEKSAPSNQFMEDALVWAQSHFTFSVSDRVANHIWAKTYRLSGQGEAEAYLKLLTPASKGANLAIESISQSFQPHVPDLIKADADKGIFLFRSHGGTAFDRRLDADIKQKVLSLYADIQSRAKSQPDSISKLPQVTCVEQIDMLLNLLDQAVSTDIDPLVTGNPFLYMRSRTVEKYRNVFRAAEPLFRRHLEKADRLPATLNHCDLRAKNIAQRPDGSICIFDWDDAVLAPPGLSLHAQFSGSMRVHLALAPSSVIETPDRRALESYLQVLSSSEQFSSPQLREGIPAAACAGVMRYITNFAEYPTTNIRERKSIVQNVRKRLSDLLDVAGALAVTHKETAAELAQVLDNNGRSERADQLRRAVADSSLPRKQYLKLLKASDPPDVFPTIEIPDCEKANGAISDSRMHLAVEMFQRHGGLLIRNAFPTELIERCRRTFDALHERHQKDISQGAALRVGDQRFMISLELSGAFADPGLISSPFVLPILHRLLTRNAILGSSTVVASMPGAKDQRLHRDNPPLFEEFSGMETPSFCIALIVPLIPLNDQTGATRIIKGSHKLRTREADGQPFQNPTVDLGSCYLMDCRLFHQGMANNSDRVRPILSLVYQRPWYRDHKNFRQQSPLTISANQLSQSPENMRKLVQWARAPT